MLPTTPASGFLAGQIGGDEAEERGQCANERVADRLSGEILAIAQWREQDARQTALVDGELVEGNGKDGHATDECAEARDREAGIHVQPGRKGNPAVFCRLMTKYTNTSISGERRMARPRGVRSASRSCAEATAEAPRESPGTVIVHARRVGT